MVKGISKQVIVVQSPEPKLFEQAIFILKEEAVGGGVSDEELLREARALLHKDPKRFRADRVRCWLYAIAGSAMTGLAWLVTCLI